MGAHEQAPGVASSEGAAGNELSDSSRDGEPPADPARAGTPGDDEANPDAADQEPLEDDADSAAELGGQEPALGDRAPVLAEAEAKRDEYLALAQRTQADFDNYRKRVAKDLAAAGARAKAGLVRELLPAIDNLERALASAPDAADGLAQGVRLVHGELVGALERSGIASFDPTGEEFDPVHHEAISTRAADGVEAGLVLDVVEKGYRSGESVLRPARVVVAG